MNGDTRTDFIIVISRTATQQLPALLYSYLIYGSSNFPNIVDLGDVGVQNPGHPLIAGAVFQQMTVIPVGDITGDGLDDLLIVARNTNGTATTAYLVFNLDGDLNADGFVGSADQNIVTANWGQSVTPSDWSMGDPSGNGVVGQDDLNRVLANWGEGVP